MNNIIRREPIYRKNLNTNDTKLVGINNFKGLQIFDNPLLADTNSTYMCKNIYRDEVGNLTVRPRIEPDPERFSTNNVVALREFTVGTFEVLQSSVVGPDVSVLEIDTNTNVLFQEFDNIVYLLITKDDVLQLYKYETEFIKVDGDIPLVDPSNLDITLYNVLNNKIKYRRYYELLQYPNITSPDMFVDIDKVDTNILLDTDLPSVHSMSYFRYNTNLDQNIIMNDNVIIHYSGGCFGDTGLYVYVFNIETNSYDVHTYDIPNFNTVLWDGSSAGKFCNNNVHIKNNGNHAVLTGCRATSNITGASGSWGTSIEIDRIIIPYDGSQLETTTIKDYLYANRTWGIQSIHALNENQFFIQYAITIFEYGSPVDTNYYTAIANINGITSYNISSTNTDITVADANEALIFETCNSNRFVVKRYIDQAYAPYNTRHSYKYNADNEVSLLPDDIYNSSQDQFMKCVSAGLIIVDYQSGGNAKLRLIQNNEIQEYNLYRTTNLAAQIAFRDSDVTRDYILDANVYGNNLCISYNTNEGVLAIYNIGLDRTYTYEYITDIPIDNIRMVGKVSVTPMLSTISIMFRVPYIRPNVGGFPIPPIKEELSLSIIRQNLSYYDTTTERETDKIPCIDEIEDEPITNFYLDNTYWFITKHHIFGTGASKGKLTIEFWDPLKYFKITEEITGAVRISDTSFWVFHKNGAYLIYKTTETLDDTVYTYWLITNTAKSKGCDFTNALTTLPISNNIATVTNMDICVVQMRKYIQSDERTLVPITLTITPFIQELLENASTIKVGSYKYLTLFCFNNKDENGITPILVYDNQQEQWYYWEFPVDCINQIIETENNIELLCKYNFDNEPRTQIFTLSTDYFEYQNNHIIYDIYCDKIQRISDVPVIDTFEQIEWFWESAIQSFKTTEYRKQLLFTNFILTDYNERVILNNGGVVMKEVEVNFDYYFSIYSQNYTEKSAKSITMSINRVKNLIERTNFSNFSYSQILLKNQTTDSDDLGDKLSLFNKPKFTGINLKYRLLSGVMT